MRVTGTPGEDLIGKDLNSPKRGWIPVQGVTHDFQTDSFLAILQHPEGAPLKLAFDTQAIIGLKSKNRVRYRTNTEGGSSGSPCFDADWNLIALHHSQSACPESKRQTS